MKKCKADIDLHRFEATCKTKIDLLKIANNANTISDVKSDMGAFYEMLGNQNASKRHIFQVIELLEKSVMLYRQANKKVDEFRVRHQLEELKVKITDSMQQFSHSIDITEPVQKMEKIFAGRSFEEKIVQLCRSIHFYSKSELHDRVLSLLAESPLASLFPSKNIDKEGKTIINLPPLDLVDPLKDTDALEKHMHDQA